MEAICRTVNYHARSLALLGPLLQTASAELTQTELARMMAQLERQYPGERELSLYASLELSLNRLSPQIRKQINILGLFHGGVNLNVLRHMTGWSEEYIAELARQLIATGLATQEAYNHLSLNPALCPYLRGKITAAEYAELQARWLSCMLDYVWYLHEQQHQNTGMAASLTLLEQANLFALLDCAQAQYQPEMVMELLNSLYSLFKPLGKPRLLQKITTAQQTLAPRLKQWSHAAFSLQFDQIQQQCDAGQLLLAYKNAAALLQQCETAGIAAYVNADYDYASILWLISRILNWAGQALSSLALLHQAQLGFQALAENNKAAQRMLTVCLTEQADCLTNLGQLEPASKLYQQAIALSEQRDSLRDVVAGKFQLCTVLMLQNKYSLALEAYNQAKDIFSGLQEPKMVAAAWHQIGMLYQVTGQADLAEDAYRQSLEITVQQNDLSGQASSLNQLGLLYKDNRQNPEPAAVYLQRAADIYQQQEDIAGEGRARSNLALPLIQLERYPEARAELSRAISCKAQFGHASESWKTWDILADLETAAGNAAAAAQARAQARASYLAYRRDGGENHEISGQIIQKLQPIIKEPGPSAALGQLPEWLDEPKFAELKTYLQALRAILQGSRDPALADHQDLDYDEAVEIQLLLESLTAD